MAAADHTSRMKKEIRTGCNRFPGPPVTTRRQAHFFVDRPTESRLNIRVKNDRFVPR